MDFFTIAIGAAVLLMVLFWRHLRQYHGLIESLGIPVIPQFLSLGSGPLAYHKASTHDEYLANFKKFGLSYGHYEGITPILNTIDPEIIKSVMVKNFDSFHSILNFEVPARYLTLDMSGGERWKVLRKFLSPTFTSGKLKGMLEPMAGVADSLMVFVEEQRTKAGSNGVVNLRPCFEGLAMDTICRCAFGIKTSANRIPKQEIVQWGRDLFSGFQATSWIDDIFFHFFFIFPGLISVLPFFPAAFDKLNKMTKDLINKRKEIGVMGDDFIARLSDVIDSMREGKDYPIEEDTVSAQGTIFFAAGFETTANTLSSLFYQLAKHPDIQEKVAQEIDEVMQVHDGKIDHETITGMPYLEACINEDLRIYGPALFHLRVCNKDCEVKPGFVIKKGTRVDMNIYASHHWPDFFPEPEAFKPERFFKENSEEIIPYTYRPFGGGPRLCIGQRFAMVEIKIAAAKLLSKYKIIATPETSLDFRKGDFFLLSYRDMKVKLELRN